MERSNLSFLVLYVGIITVVAVFNAIIYRVGHVTMMPGEPRRQVLNFVLAVAIGFALGLAVPQGHWLLGSSASWVITLIGLGSIAVLLFTRRWLKRWLARMVPKQPPEVQAEVERRTRFMRGRQGRWLFVAMFLSIIIWLLFANFAISPSLPAGWFPSANGIAIDTQVATAFIQSQWDHIGTSLRAYGSA